MNEVDRDRQLGALIELCHELIKLGIKVGLSDARPALSVRSELVTHRLWIEVDPSGTSFVWRRSDQVRHAVGDPAGAAAQIAEYLTRRDVESGDRP